MKRIIILLFCITMSFCFAQEKLKTSIFHRMLIQNKNNEILVVKLKNKNFWVTPGLYHNGRQTVQQGIDSIAKTYGITVEKIKLQAKYGLQIPGKKSFSTRNMYTMRTTSNVTQLPKIIGQYKWLSIDEAVQTINIPHINDFIKDVFSHPDKIRGGIAEMTTKNDDRYSKIVQDFYTISNINFNTELEKINKVLLDYIEGTANGHPDRVRNVFHNDLNLYHIKNDSLVVWSGKNYVNNIKKGQKSNRIGRIISVDYENDAAIAKIEILMPKWKRIYTDYLMLLKINSMWKIIHKSFTFRSYPE